MRVGVYIYAPVYHRVCELDCRFYGTQDRPSKICNPPAVTDLVNLYSINSTKLHVPVLSLPCLLPHTTLHLLSPAHRQSLTCDTHLDK